MPLWHSCLVFSGALLLSLGISAAMLALQDKPALDGIVRLFQGAFGSTWALEDCLVKAIPLFLCSLGVAVAFRLQIWNIGAEGQFALGAIGATWFALNFNTLGPLVMLPGMLAMALLAGGVWSLIPALLKLRMKANEIIVTLMMNYIAILFLDYLVYGRWKDPESYGFPMTPVFSPAAVVATIGSTRLNWGLLLCFLFGIFIWIFFRYSRLGFELQASGESVRCARYARLPYERLVVLVMVISGALAGCAGFLEASANLNRLQPSIMVGYGYTAIVVAWLAKLNPLYIGLASFLLAGLRVGVENLQLDLQVPAAFGSIMEGLILLTVLAAAVQSGTPILFATLGEIVTEKVGILNLGVEGMMMVGALAGFIAALYTGQATLAFMVGGLAGALLASLHGLVCIGFQGNQVVSGLALTILGTGLADYLGTPFVGQKVTGFSPVALPLLSAIPGLGPVFFKQDPLVYVSYLVVPVLWLFFRNTKWGLRMRSVGEYPEAAFAAGLPVHLYRWVGVIGGGFLVGLGGAYLSLAYTHLWTSGMSAGRGWIAVALVIFAFWRPERALIGAYLFGGIMAFQLRLQAMGTHIPSSLLLMLPYGLTVLVLVLSSRKDTRAQSPAALGINIEPAE